MIIEFYSGDGEFLNVIAHGHNDAGFVQYHSTSRPDRKNRSTAVSVLNKFHQFDATVDCIDDWD